MPSDQDTIPGELAAIHARLDKGDQKFTSLERDVAENTRITAESAEVLREVRDALIFARVGTKRIKWLGAIGGFAPEFYSAYGSSTHGSLPAGYETRKHLYNLYHLLNHLNLFGAGYLARCEWTIARVLAGAGQK